MTMPTREEIADCLSGVNAYDKDELLRRIVDALDGRVTVPPTPTGKMIRAGMEWYSSNANNDHDLSGVIVCIYVAMLAAANKENGND
jgi:hypothetical protein